MTKLIPVLDQQVFPEPEPENPFHEKDTCIISYNREFRPKHISEMLMEKLMLLDVTTVLGYFMGASKMGNDTIYFMENMIWMSIPNGCVWDFTPEPFGEHDQWILGSPTFGHTRTCKPPKSMMFTRKNIIFVPRNGSLTLANQFLRSFCHVCDPLDSKANTAVFTR